MSKRLLPIKLIKGKISVDEKIYNNGVEIGKILIDENYPFALVKYLDKNFDKIGSLKVKMDLLKFLYPKWLNI